MSKAEPIANERGVARDHFQTAVVLCLSKMFGVVWSLRRTSLREVAEETIASDASVIDTTLTRCNVQLELSRVADQTASILIWIEEGWRLTYEVRTGSFLRRDHLGRTFVVNDPRTLLHDTHAQEFYLGELPCAI